MTASLTRLCGAVLRTDRLTEGYWPVGAGGGRCTTYIQGRPSPMAFFFFIILFKLWEEVWQHGEKGKDHSISLSKMPICTQFTYGRACLDIPPPLPHQSTPNSWWLMHLKTYPRLRVPFSGMHSPQFGLTTSVIL